MCPEPAILPTYLDLSIDEARTLAGLITDHCGDHDERRRVRLARIDGSLYVGIASATWVLELSGRAPGRATGRARVIA